MGSYVFRYLAAPYEELLAWHAVVTATSRFTDAANEFWGFAFDQRASGSRSAYLLGPTMRPRQLDTASQAT